MRSTSASMAALACVIAWGAGTAAAQDFGGQVVRDPRADTATYGFHFDGPPRGQAWLIAGTSLLPEPIPTPFGNLWLDPFGINFPVLPRPLPLDNSGQADFQLVLPLRLVDLFPFGFQTLFVDPFGRLQLSQNAFPPREALLGPPNRR